MLPEGFVKRLKTQKYIDPEKLREALDQPSPVSIRINPGKWEKTPAGSVPVPWCNGGYYLNERYSFTADPLFHAGCYYPQEASGIFIGEVFRQIADADDNLKVLDLCSAPGGKATHLSSLLGSGGLLVANEVIRQRASVLGENITRWGATNTLITQNDPADFSSLPGFFDLILVDAPCSGEGMFRDAVARREWSEENALHCSVRQRRIFAGVWPALKEDGILIYSTCTFNPAENEENVNWLSSNYQAESVKIDIDGFDGIVKICHKGISGYGFYPDRLKGEGLFISVIRKTGRNEKSARKEIKETGSRLSKEDLKTIKDRSIFREESLLKAGGEIISIAGSRDDYFHLSRKLRIIKGGTTVCRVKNRVYLPSYQLALSQGFRKDSFPGVELGYEQAIAFLRRDVLHLPGHEKGWFVVTYGGVSLGFINNLGNRLNNYYPVNWRIKMEIPENGYVRIIRWND